MEALKSILADTLLFLPTTHYKILPIIDLILIELFSDTKASDFRSEVDSIDGGSSGRPNRSIPCLTLFSVNFLNLVSVPMVNDQSFVIN